MLTLQGHVNIHWATYATIIGTSGIKIALALDYVSGILSTNHFYVQIIKKIKTQIFLIHFCHVTLIWH